jgi:hypothetical protein
MAPTGYTRKKGGRLVLNPEAAPHVAEVFRRRALGGSWTELADYLREHNVMSPYGNDQWTSRAVSHVIANRAYLGEARSGEFSNADAHPPIIDEATWTAAQKAAGIKPTNGLGGALLAGVVRCAGCGFRMKIDSVRSRGMKLRQYRCRVDHANGKCPEPASVLGRVIEPLVETTFFTGLGDMRAEGTVAHEDLREAEEALLDAEMELATFLEAVKAADLGGDVFAAAARQRQEAVVEARQAVQDARGRAGVADLPLESDLRLQWPEMTVKERNELLRAGFDAILIERGRLPIEHRVQVYWRGEAPADVLQGRPI